MRITINIPRNDYVLPTEVRQDVVQHICEAFLTDSCWCVFHPYPDGLGRSATRGIYVVKDKGREFSSSGERFNGAEMAAAFKVLIAAGYHMFRVYSYNTWMGYICSKKPFEHNGTEVKEFTDFID